MLVERGATSPWPTRRLPPPHGIVKQAPLDSQACQSPRLLIQQVPGPERLRTRRLEAKLLRHTEIGAPHTRRIEQLVGRAVGHQVARLHDIAPVRDA